MGTMEATQDIDTEGTLDRRHTRPCSVWPPTGTSQRVSASTARRPGRSGILEPACRDQHRDGPDHRQRTISTLCAAHSSSPNAANPCRNPMDANWTSPFGFGTWASERKPRSAGWAGQRIPSTMIDATSSSRRGEQGVARLAGLAGRLGFTGRRAGRSPGVVGDTPTDLGGQLPHGRRTARRVHDGRLGQARHADPARHGVGSRALRASLLRRTTWPRPPGAPCTGRLVSSRWRRPCTP